MIGKKLIVGLVVLTVLLCRPCVAAEPERKVPFKGDEVPLVRIKAGPAAYVGKEFVICGAVQLDDYYSYEYWNAAGTHHSLFLAEVSQDGLPLAERAFLYLSRKTGAPIIERLLAKQEKAPKGQSYLVRATATILPARFDPNGWQLFELLDIQFPTEGWKDWEEGVLAKMEADKAKAKQDSDRLAIERAQQFAEEKQKQLKALEPQFRTWTDKSGKYKTVARFSGMAVGNVKLQLENGQVIMVSVDNLSDADKEYLEERRRMAARKR